MTEADSDREKRGQDSAVDDQCATGGCEREPVDVVDLGPGPKALCRPCKAAYLAGHSGGQGDFGKWLRERKEEARKQYKSGGPRSADPRQTDIQLGKHRAYKQAFQEYLDRALDGEAEEWAFEEGEVIREEHEMHAPGGVPIGKSEYKVKYRVRREGDGERCYLLEKENAELTLYAAGAIEGTCEVIEKAESQTWPRDGSTGGITDAG
ncbi:hypothetical protein [Halorhabdus rudnickae]|uniref:hypothetical protein n=1 Tax=Halorhabdus rudnickae TaxID=1775544 RepID=UPI0010844246|nr:hypothetical protein [Halorhabdus rudnickae]